MFDGPRKCLLEAGVDKAANHVVTNADLPQEVLDSVNSAFEMILQKGS